MLSAPVLSRPVRPARPESPTSSSMKRIIFGPLRQLPMLPRVQHSTSTESLSHDVITIPSPLLLNNLATMTKARTSDDEERYVCWRRQGRSRVVQEV